MGYVNNMIGTPWQPRGQPERTPLAPGQPLPASRLEGVVPQPRGVYITRERQIKYGRTKGCPGCETACGEAPKKHSPECRARFEKLLAEEPAPGPRASEGEQPAEAKKPKAESPSRKREAEGPPEAPEEEMVAGLPTIHDCMIVASLPTEVEEKEVMFYDERTGEALETSEVYKGRDKELTKM